MRVPCRHQSYQTCFWEDLQSYEEHTYHQEIPNALTFSHDWITNGWRKADAQESPPSCITRNPPSTAAKFKLFTSWFHFIQNGNNCASKTKLEMQAYFKNTMSFVNLQTLNNKHCPSSVSCQSWFYQAQLACLFYFFELNTGRYPIPFSYHSYSDSSAEAEDYLIFRFPAHSLSHLLTVIL